MARPKKDTAEKRDQRFNLRYTLAEMEHIRTQAQAAGLDPHEYARRRTLGHVVTSAPSSTADPALIVALNRVGNNVNQLARSVHRGSDFQRYWQEVGDELRTVLAKTLEGFSG